MADAVVGLAIVVAAAGAATATDEDIALQRAGGGIDGLTHINIALAAALALVEEDQAIVGAGPISLGFRRHDLIGGGIVRAAGGEQQDGEQSEAFHEDKYGANRLKRKTLLLGLRFGAVGNADGLRGDGAAAVGVTLAGGGEAVVLAAGAGTFRAGQRLCEACADEAATTIVATGVETQAAAKAVIPVIIDIVALHGHEAAILDAGGGHEHAVVGADLAGLGFGRKELVVGAQLRAAGGEQEGEEQPEVFHGGNFTPVFIKEKGG